MKDSFKRFSILIISCLGIIIYSNSFHCTFQYDDIFSIAYNSAIKNIHDLSSIWHYLPRRFMLYFSLALNYHLNGVDVFGYHLFNFLVHVGTAVLVCWLTLLTLSTPVMKEEKIARHANLISLFAGLVFVAHPIQTEAVTYIVQRAASMATFFYLASLCLYVKSRLSQENGEGLGRRYYLGAWITAVMAMFTKETAITLPLMVVLYEYSFFNNRKFRLSYLLTVFIIPATMVLTETSSVRVHQLQSEPGISPIHYLLTQFRVIVTYIRLCFLPINQNIDYDYPVFKSLFQTPVLASFLFLAMILFFAKRLFLKYRLISFSIFWFFLALLPESSILPIRDIIFEHRLYLPLVGYSIFLVGSMYYLVGKHSLRMMVIITTGVVLCYSILTYERNKVWSNEVTLWDDAAQKSPHKPEPVLNRAIAYLLEGDLDRALADFNKSIAMNPNYAEAYTFRGLIYEQEGKLMPALIEYTKAIMIDPKYQLPYYYRGLLYKKLGKRIKDERLH